MICLAPAVPAVPTFCSPGDECRFNNWNTGNYHGNNQFKPSGFIQNRFKRLKALDQGANMGAYGQCASGQETGQKQSEQDRQEGEGMQICPKSCDNLFKNYVIPEGGRGVCQKIMLDY